MLAHRANAALAVLLISFFTASCTHNGGPGFATLPVQPPIHDQGIIKHVIIIVQENRSFDNLFNGFPGADTVSTGRTRSGSVPLTAVPLENPLDVGHSHGDFLTSYNNGQMNGFAGVLTYKLINGMYTAVAGPPNYMYAYVPQAEITPYWTLAQQFTVADRMFQSNSGPSFPAHQYLIAGQSNNADEVPSGMPWGCDAPSGTTVPQLQDDGSDSKGIFPCFDYQTLADELDSAQIGWKMYAPGMGTTGYLFNAYDAVRHIRFSGDWDADDVAPETTVLTDISGGTLQPVSWVIPSFVNSDHALSGSNTGPQWVASIVNAVGASQYWNDTAILITWDDWGGWYDHAPPPQLDPMGLGFRVPLLLVSPYARHGYVSHIYHEFGSILHFTEATFGLSPLSASDARADELTDCFDFTQAPQPLQPVATRMKAADFLSQPRTLEPPDPE